MDEARLRDENSGLWFSPQPAAQMHGARNPDSVLFNLAKVAAPPTSPEPPKRTRGHLKIAEGSGLIDIGTLAAMNTDPSADPPASAPLVDLMPSLVPRKPTFTYLPAPEPRGVHPVLYAVPAVLGVAICVLGYLVIS